MRTKPLSEITKTICKNINICMQVKNTKQDVLAAAIGASQQAVSRFTQGHCIPKPEQVVAICDYYNISIDQLYGKKELVVLTDSELIYYNYIISNSDIFDEIKKSIVITPTTDLRIEICKLIKNDSSLIDRINNSINSK